MGERSEETVLAEIPVSYHLEFGREQLVLFLTEARIIIAHVGKSGRGQAVGSEILGSLSAAVESLFTLGRESRRKSGLRKRTPREILAAHKDNFYIKYGEIVQVDLAGGTTGSMITILTNRDKIELSTRLPVENVQAAMIDRLGNKLSTTHL